MGVGNKDNGGLYPLVLSGQIAPLARNVGGSLDQNGFRGVGLGNPQRYDRDTRSRLAILDTTGLGTAQLRPSRVLCNAQHMQLDLGGSYYCIEEPDYKKDSSSANRSRHRGKILVTTKLSSIYLTLRIHILC
jgi:hypothetical protein